MNTASSNNTPWVYLYPLRMSCKDEEFIEFFVTFDEPNLFVEPYDSLGIKMTATVFYLIALLGAFIQYSCIIYEVNGYAASFRTAINQLVSAAYFMVSFIWNIGSEKKIPLKTSVCNPFIRCHWIWSISSLVWPITSWTLLVLPSFQRSHRQFWTLHNVGNYYSEVRIHLHLAKV